MKKIGIGILLLTILFSLVSCEKENDFDGELTFYTNAQALLNCGPFDIYVYVDSEQVGILSQALALLETDPQPNCGDPLCLTIKKKEGEYSFSAEGECGYENLFWEGDFQIMKDSCTRIFLDLNEITGN
jgi:hypothetical protein